MKRFLSFLALTLLWPIWRAPAWAQLTTLGVGGVVAVAIGMLTPPSIVPLPGSYFNVAGPWGLTNNGLQPNGGADSGTNLSFGLPSTPSNSMVIYLEGSVDPSITYYGGGEYTMSKGGTAYSWSRLQVSRTDNRRFWRSPFFPILLGLSGGKRSVSIRTPPA